MQRVNSFEELQQKIAEIRSLRLGFMTNFFPDSSKHAFWIGKRDCFTERIGNTLFVIKKSPDFWNVFYCTTTLDALAADLDSFHNANPRVTMMYDIVGRDIQCKPLVELFEGKGCKEATSLVRMMRMTEPVDYEPTTSIRLAKQDDLKEISELLHTFFDERTEQIPYDEELSEYTKHGHVLICEEDKNTAGFLIYEMNVSTLYLRYWFTHPDYREKKVGSRLLRRFFEDGKETKRQLFWVIRSNENAIKRYKHYGFKEENMYDFVMQYN
ncbi:MAG: GNAT family N-acetyltransferase [Bacteroidales bacterium]|nr:GNAT family N-acetyltransferase [Bacteroidales bacterium]